MITAEDSPLERLLRDRIEQLRAEGWTVTREPGPLDLPEPLRSARIRFDYLARRDQDILIGEIAHRGEARQEHIDDLARQVAAVPGARFEVYWAGPAPAPAPDPGQVRRYIREAQAVAGASPQAALLMALAAFEGAVAAFAEDAGIQAKVPARQMLANLYSLGYIGKPDYDALSRLYKLRSAIAHQASPLIPEPGDIAFCLDLVSRMVDGRYIAADQLIDWFRQHYEHPAEHAAPQGDYRGRDEITVPLRAAFPYAGDTALAEAADWLQGESAAWAPKSGGGSALRRVRQGARVTPVAEGADVVVKRHPAGARSAGRVIAGLRQRRPRALAAGAAPGRQVVTRLCAFPCLRGFRRHRHADGGGRRPVPVVRNDRKHVLPEGANSEVSINFGALNKGPGRYPQSGRRQPNEECQKVMGGLLSKSYSAGPHAPS
jgi:hypothetical protein